MDEIAGEEVDDFGQDILEEFEGFFMPAQ